MNNIESMRVFVNTVKLGSMAKAAHRLNVTPPSISKTISKLENKLGTQLIIRTTRKNYLTEAGQTYFNACDKILSEIDEVHRALTEDTKATKGIIRINAPVSFTQHILYEAVDVFQKKNANTSFSIQCSDEMIELLDSEFDFAIRITDNLEDTSARARLVSKTQLRLCASPKYIEKHGALSSPYELSNHNCISYSNDRYRQKSSWRGVWEGVQQTFEMNGDVIVNNGDVAVNFALCGKGLALQPDFIVKPYIASGALVEVLSDARWPVLNIYIVYPNTKHVPARVRNFIDFIVNYFDDDDCLSNQHLTK